MFNTQIDVAKIMEKIKADVAKKGSAGTIRASASENISSSEPEETLFDTAGIKTELARIDTYVYNVNDKSNDYVRIGERIRISPKSKGLIRKLKIFFKRCVRKSTRFLAEDQIEVNQNSVNCIRALSEYNNAMLPVVDGVDELYKQNILMRQHIQELEKSEKAHSEQITKLLNESRKLFSNITRLSSALEAIDRKFEDKLAEYAASQTESYESRLAEFEASQTQSFEIRLDEFKTLQTQSNESRLAEFEASQTESFESRLAEFEISQSKSYENRLVEFEHSTDLIAERFDEVRREIKEQRTEQVKLEKANEIISDKVYESFLSRFRGSDEELSVRMSYYLDKFDNFGLTLDRPHLLVDIGSGNGVFLKCVKNRGLNGLGVDINSELVEICKKNGINAVVCDALEYLRKQPDSSVDVITSFQVIEHLDISLLPILIDEIYRVLKPGGTMLLETPNTHNLEVGAWSFWEDPTHVRPVNQNYVQFICGNVGFTKTIIEYWKTKEVNDWIESFNSGDNEIIRSSTTVNAMLTELRKTLFDCPDYAVIAKK